MEILNNLLLGAGVAFTLVNLSYCFLGVLIGTIVGVLPGLGPLAAMSMLLPLMYGLPDPATALIFLAGIYYGTQYGGSTTAILLKLPGEASSLITTIDGYSMTRNGRGGAALCIAALSSFFAGTVATVFIAMVGQPIANFAIAFAPVDYASLMILGLLACVALSQGSLLKGVGMVLVGILLGTVGTDINSGVIRFGFDIPYLSDGIMFAVVAMGLFGLGEILYSLFHEPKKTASIPTLKELYPTQQEFRDSLAPTARGTLIGGLLGLLPGTGAIMSSFASYVAEKKISKKPEQFGQGAVAGVAGPEAANNAGAQTGFIPLLSLGIPTTPIMALMLAALIVNGIQPGPQVIGNYPNIFWGLIISMFVGNLLLVVLNLPLIGLWIRLLRIPRQVLYPSIVAICMTGIYYINNSWFDVALLIPFALAGYLLKILECEPAPLAMGFVLGVQFEEYFRRALTIASGDWNTFLTSPISLTFLIVAVTITVITSTFKLRT